MASGSTPSLTEFDPTPIPFQYDLLEDIRCSLDFNLGTWELLASGAVGSSKSMVGAHLAVTHCLMHEHASFMIGRQTMPSLKQTLIKRIQEHIGDSIGYDYNKQSGIFTFPNKSQIIPISWADGHFKKVRSYEFTSGIIEELTENEDPEFYEEILSRIGRQTHVKEKFLLSLTNPDDPSHWAYDRFIGNPKSLTKVYYSKTADNPFLPHSYVAKLQETLDPKLARRMLFGEWLSIRQDVVYYSYSKDHNFKKGPYKVNPNYPVHMSFDFNIGIGKPLSLVLFQFIKDEFHFFDEVVIEGARTEDALEEAYGRGYFNYETTYEIHGDATGKHRDTRSRHSDYDVIKNWLNNCKNKKGEYIRFSINVPLTNPKVRERHNMVNAQLENSKGERHIFVYEACKVLDEGFRLTKLKDGANYVEDDSKYYQHITTAAGYGIVWCVKEQGRAEITVLR